MNIKRYQIRILAVSVLLVVFFLSACQSANGPLPNGSAAPRSENDLAQAEQLVQAGSYEEALKSYAQIIQKGDASELSVAYEGLGNLYVQLRRFDDAERAYTMALQDGSRASILAGRCNAYRMLARFDDAIRDCQQAVEMDPTSEDSRAALALVYSEQGEIDKVREQADAMLQNNPESAKGNFVLYQAELKAGNFDAAEQAITKSIEIEPENAYFYWERGFLYYMIGKVSEAKADMNKILELGNPDTDGELLLNAGTLLNMLSGVK